VAMAAHPQIKQADAEVIADYILGLADVKPRLATEGEFVAAVPEGDKGEGVYLLRAAYKDRGFMDLPAQSSEQVYVLRNPSMNPHMGDKYEGIQKMTFGGTKLTIPSGSGTWIMFDQIDLSGISQVDFMVVAPKAAMNAAGGSLELHLDTPDGPLAGQTHFIEASDEPGFAANKVSALVNPTTGLHNIYLVFRNDKAPAGQSLFVLTGIKFQTPEMLAAEAAAASAPAVQPSATALEAYAGKYKFTGLPFEFIKISVEDGALMSDNGGQKGALKATVTADRFDANGQAMFQFVRDGDGKVTGMKLEAMGMSFEGKRE
jgi:cytochrome c